MCSKLQSLRDFLLKCGLHLILGLILGLALPNLQSAFGSQLKMSSLLDMYYSERGIPTQRSYRACQRKEHLSTVAPIETLQSQVRSQPVSKAMQPARLWCRLVMYTNQALTEFSSGVFTVLNFECFNFGFEGAQHYSCIAKLLAFTFHQGRHPRDLHSDRC